MWVSKPFVELFANINFLFVSNRIWDPMALTITVSTPRMALRPTKMVWEVIQRAARPNGSHPKVCQFCCVTRPMPMAIGHSVTISQLRIQSQTTSSSRSKRIALPQRLELLKESSMNIDDWSRTAINFKKRIFLLIKWQVAPGIQIKDSIERERIMPIVYTMIYHWAQLPRSEWFTLLHIVANYFLKLNYYPINSAHSSTLRKAKQLVRLRDGISVNLQWLSHRSHIVAIIYAINSLSSTERTTSI